MEIITILIMSCIILATLMVLLRMNMKYINFIKKIGNDRKLNEITNSLPDNEVICKEILSMLGNERVNVKVGDENKQASLYIVATNTILIANIKNTFTRVQTIAHECIHSVQDKRLLWFNFAFSNVYLLYFYIVTFLTLINKISSPNIFAIILVMMSIMMFFVRSFLEIDAMTKARFLAEKYMLRNPNKIKEDNVELIVENYDRLNSVGIKFYDFSLLAKCLVRVIIYCVIALV